MTTPGSLLTEIYTWVRRIVKPNSDEELSNSTIRSYLNRFVMYDLPQETELFELSQRYSFDTIPNTNYYQFPPRDSNGNITQDYVLIKPPMYCDGTQIGFFQSDYQFYRAFPEQVFNAKVATGDGVTGQYPFTLQNIPVQKTFQLANKTNIPDPDDNTQKIQTPFINPAVIISSVDVNGNSVYLIDDGDGNLNQVDNAFLNILSYNAGSINYITGVITTQFLTAIEDDQDIYCQSLPYQAARPIALLFQSGYLKVYPVPDKAYKIDIDCMISPAQFIDSVQYAPYAYMSEYIARGIARKILLDSGDIQQLNLYEAEFKRQKLFVLRRSSKQRNVERVPTIYSTYSGTPLFYQQQ